MMDDMLDKPRNVKPAIGIAVAVLLAAAGGWYWSHRHVAAPPVETLPNSPAPASAPEERIEHPVPPAPPPGSGQAALPELNDSDRALYDALANNAAALTQFLVPDSIVRHVVVTVDNLPRQKVAADKRPVMPTAGALLADGDELHATLDPRNYDRYSALVQVIRNTDMQRVANVYLRFYPLFQKAYQDLGYPSGYFNDRLVKVIDVLLATPQPAQPIDLVRPNVMYVFADPALEALPAGQKVLIRMGPDNAAVVKAKLMEFRAIVTAAAPAH